MRFRSMRSALVYLVATAPCVAAPSTPGHPIIGVWSVYLADTACAETWDIRADGTTHNVSGAEESFSEYTTSASLTAKGYYVFKDRITKTNGRPDCMGTLTPVGDAATDYLVPLPGDRFKLCRDSALAQCVGLLVRAPK